MAEIISPTSIHPINRLPNNTTNQQRGSFKGVQVQGGIVQDTAADLNFDLKNGTNVLVAQRAGEKQRKGVPLDKASQFRKGAEKRASQTLGDFSEVYGGMFRSFLTELKNTQKKKRPNLSDLRDLAEQFFGEDESVCHAAILAAANIESEMGNNDGLEDMLRQLAQNLMEEKGSFIQAGYNVNPIIKLFAGEHFDTFRALRDAYRETLLSDANEEQIYEFLIHVLPLRLRRILRKPSKYRKEKQKTNTPDWENTEEEEY